MRSRLSYPEVSDMKSELTNHLTNLLSKRDFTALNLTRYSSAEVVPGHISRIHNSHNGNMLDGWLKMHLAYILPGKAPD